MSTVDQLTLIGVNGAKWDLLDCTSEVKAGGSLPIFGAVPVDVAATPHRYGGSRPTGVRVEAAPQRLPVVLEASSRADLADLNGRFWGAINPELGDCSLIVTNHNGLRRERRIRYEAGFIGLDAPPSGRARLVVPQLLFRAHDPAWYQLPSPAASVSGSVPAGTGSTEVLDIVNDGDQRVWPVIRISVANAAPGSIQLTAANLDTGDKWTWFNPIEDLFGSVEIDHAERTATALREFTASPPTSVYRGFDALHRALWPLRSGPNRIAFEATSPHNISLSVRWTPRWSTPC